MLWLALSSGNDFGWGVCSQAIRDALGARMKVRNIGQDNPPPQKRVEGIVLHTLKDSLLNTEHEIWGDVNWGYTFNEFTLGAKALENAKRLDGIFAGSTWCQRALQGQGLGNVHVLVQGVDHKLFNPEPGKPRKDKAFRIFSGGKLEYRKGQDIVIEVFRRLQRKHRQIELVTAWWNPWPETLESLRLSPYIDYAPMNPGQSWFGYAHGLCAINLLFPNRIHHHERIPHKFIAEVMKSTDLGLFLSRCEGGTNLVMMEYMACGKPTIASGFTGHEDVLNGENAWRIHEQQGLTLPTDDPESVGNWFEPDIEEVEAIIEFMLNDQDAKSAMQVASEEAASSMKQWTWERTAQTIVEVMGL